MRAHLLIISMLLGAGLHAQPVISTSKVNGIALHQAAVCYDGANDYEVVKKAMLLFAADIQKVTGATTRIYPVVPGTAKQIVLLGSIERSSYIKDLIARKKINADSIRGKWEAYQVQVVKEPFPGIGQALVIMGSDRRGTAYGAFELSRQMGVSPWYWWADVPVRRQQKIYVGANTLLRDAPAVKYRGIFINDEAPALSGWSKEQFGGFNHRFYEKVFELMLRLKSNYLWPAMWGNAFYDDDSLNIKTADDYGIVIGTSHHEPLMRAHDEWRRYGSGKWNYDSNAARLQEFWRGGLARTGNTEKIVSVGMRGDGDEPMTQGTAIALLERIVKDQRAIIESVTKKPAAETPQLWALYKEVQDYYDKGMRVPDDVTLLLCDDNWGNLRKLPKLHEPPRRGGYGIYYHFDYVGGPRNYKWINTNNIARVWEQMHLAWEYNARQVWIVNVGDIKPMEFPISFFLDYAWAPQRIQQNDLVNYYTQWGSAQFGTQYGSAAGNTIRRYSQYAARRKPELLSASTYNNSEWPLVLNEFTALENEAASIARRLPAAYQDAYFQLVLHPVQALANLHRMYAALAQGDSLKASAYFDKDSLITLHYNKGIANGKWNHLMDQTHIGYTNWQQPPVNKMPAPLSPSQIPARHAGKVQRFTREAATFTRAVNTNGATWTVIPDIGKTSSGICAFPVTLATQQPGGNSPHVQYDIVLQDTGTFTLEAHCSPTLNFHNTETGLRYAVSIDDEQPQVIAINKEDNDVRVWSQWVSDNVIVKTSTHSITSPGRHVLRFWMVDAGVVLQKFVITHTTP